MKRENSYRVLVADDELPSRQLVCELIKQDTRFKVVSVCESGQSALSQIRSTSLDVLFLDIQMPNINGLKVAEAIQGPDAPLVVFVTAYGNYAVRAFEREAFDYVEKPIGQDRFSRVMDRVFRRLTEMKTLDSRLPQSASQEEASGVYPSTSSGSKRLLSAVRQDLIYQEPEIQVIESSGNYVNVRIGGESYLVRESLENFFKNLESSDFLRVHRSYVVNVQWVSKMRYGKSGSAELFLTDGYVVPVSRSQRNKVSQVLKRIDESIDVQDSDYKI